MYASSVFKTHIYEILELVFFCSFSTYLRNRSKCLDMTWIISIETMIHVYYFFWSLTRIHVWIIQERAPNALRRSYMLPGAHRSSQEWLLEVSAPSAVFTVSVCAFILQVNTGSSAFPSHQYPLTTLFDIFRHFSVMWTSRVQEPRLQHIAGGVCEREREGLLVRFWLDCITWLTKNNRSRLCSVEVWLSRNRRCAYM